MVNRKDNEAMTCPLIALNRMSVDISCKSMRKYDDRVALFVFHRLAVEVDSKVLMIKDAEDEFVDSSGSMLAFTNIGVKDGNIGKSLPPFGVFTIINVLSDLVGGIIDSSGDLWIKMESSVPNSVFSCRSREFINRKFSQSDVQKGESCQMEKETVSGQKEDFGKDKEDKIGTNSFNMVLDDCQHKESKESKVRRDII